jgi:hypothetical protein
MRLFYFILGIPVALQFSFCTGKSTAPAPGIQSFRPIEAQFNLGDASRFEFQFVSAVGDGAESLLVAYSKLNRQDGKNLGNFFRVSTDGGSSFGPEQKAPGGALRFVEGGLTAVSTTAAAGGSNITHRRSFDGGANWTGPTQINDEEGSVRWGFGGGFSFVQPTPNDAYCLWTDRRRGFISLFSSASHDGGLTWSANQAVEYDFREGEQSAPKLLTGADGRLIAIWIDWRDRQTLADIRSSYSDDGGRHWSASLRINDDSEHVWQIAPTAVAMDNKVFVAFQDFRDAGEEGDNDWNIYFARSEDNGATWMKNVRMNDIQQGEDAGPSLSVDESGTLHCAWKTGRYSIFGDVALSHSTDGGRTWTASVVLSESRELMIRQPHAAVPVSKGRLLCEWGEAGFDSSKTRLAWLEPLVGPADTPATRAVDPGDERDSVKAPPRGEIVFSDDFSAGNVERWQAASGVWTVVDGALMGVEPAAPSPFAIYGRMEEPDRYVVSGRFKLDSVAHHVADLYFRWAPGGKKYYQITNQFRFGVWMGLRDGDPRAPVSGSQLASRPLVQRRFPFQNSRWYEFVLAVAPERVDYFVDGRLMLSHTQPLRLPPGRFGIGGAGQAPTYFDDIVISRPAAR